MTSLHLRIAPWIAFGLLVLPLAQATTDNEGDTPVASMDIVEVRLENDGASTIDVVMEVSDMGVQAPSNTVVVSYTVDLCTSDNGAVCYRLQANPGDNSIVADFFRARVKAADGSFCTVGDILAGGSFDRTANTVTWTLTKASLNFDAAPSTGCVGGTRGGVAMAGAGSVTSLQGSTELTVGLTGNTVVLDSTASGSTPTCVGLVCVETYGPVCTHFWVDVQAGPVSLYFMVFATCLL